MNSLGADKCEGFYSDGMLQQALSDKVFQKYSQALTRDALKAAEITKDLVISYHQYSNTSLDITS